MTESDNSQSLPERIAASLRDQLDSGNSRRQFLQRTAAAGGGLLLVGTGSSLAQQADDDPEDRFDDQEGTDLDVLNYVLTVKRLQRDLYSQGLEEFTEQEFAEVTGDATEETGATATDGTGDTNATGTEDTTTTDTQDNATGTGDTNATGTEDTTTTDTQDNATGTGDTNATGTEDTTTTDTQDNATGTGETNVTGTGETNVTDSQNNVTGTEDTNTTGTEETNTTGTETVGTQNGTGEASDLQQEGAPTLYAELQQFSRQEEEHLSAVEETIQMLSEEEGDQGVGEPTQGNQTGEDEEPPNRTAEDDMVYDFDPDQEEQGNQSAAPDTETGNQTATPDTQVGNQTGNQSAAPDTETGNQTATPDTQQDGLAQPTQEVSFEFEFESVEDFLSTAAEIENTAVGAYAGAARFVENPDLLDTVLSIHSVDARHGAVLNRAAGMSAAPDTFDPALSQSEVESTVSQYAADTSDTTGDETETDLGGENTTNGTETGVGGDNATNETEIGVGGDNATNGTETGVGGDNATNGTDNTTTGE